MTNRFENDFIKSVRQELENPNNIFVPSDQWNPVIVNEEKPIRLANLDPIDQKKLAEETMQKVLSMFDKSFHLKSTKLDMSAICFPPIESPERQVRFTFNINDTQLHCTIGTDVLFNIHSEEERLKIIATNLTQTLLSYLMSTLSENSRYVDQAIDYLLYRDLKR